MTSLNIIGAGHVGGALGRLWHHSGTFELLGILNRSVESGQAAVSFIGTGTAVDRYAALPEADAYMIGSPDDAIASCASALADSRPLNGSIVFHCSGSLPS